MHSECIYTHRTFRKTFRHAAGRDRYASLSVIHPSTAKASPVNSRSSTALKLGTLLGLILAAPRHAAAQPPSPSDAAIESMVQERVDRKQAVGIVVATLDR